MQKKTAQLGDETHRVAFRDAVADVLKSIGGLGMIQQVPFGESQRDHRPPIDTHMQASAFTPRNAHRSLSNGLRPVCLSSDRPAPTAPRRASAAIGRSNLPPTDVARGRHVREKETIREKESVSIPPPTCVSLEGWLCHLLLVWGASLSVCVHAAYVPLLGYEHAVIRVSASADKGGLTGGKLMEAFEYTRRVSETPQPPHKQRTKTDTKWAVLCRMVCVQILSEASVSLEGGFTAVFSTHFFLYVPHNLPQQPSEPQPSAADKLSALWDLLPLPPPWAWAGGPLICPATNPQWPETAGN